MMIDLEKQIKNHTDWITLIRGLFEHPSSSFINSSIIENHHICHLGKWLDSQKQENQDENHKLQNLIDVHKEFHENAGQILELVQLQKHDEAWELESKLQYLSDEIIRLLNELEVSGA